MRKYWIFVKCGLSRDPKHRAAMGECVWLYLHILDRADFETGIVFDWKDEDEAKEMGMQVDTLRHQRRKLAELDYITCRQRQHNLEIVIHNWVNPRDYSGGVKNHKFQGGVEIPPSKNQGGNQSGNQGGNQGTSPSPTPTSTPRSKISRSSNKEAPPEVLKIFTNCFGKLNGTREADRWAAVVDLVGIPVAKEIAAWAHRREIHLTNRPALLDSLETAAKKWKVKASAQTGPRSFAAIREYLEDEDDDDQQD